MNAKWVPALQSCLLSAGTSWVAPEGDRAGMEAAETRPWGSRLFFPLRVSLVLLALQWPQARCRAPLLSLLRVGAGGCWARLWEALQGAFSDPPWHRSPLALGSPATCPSSWFQPNFSLLLRVEHPNFTPLPETYIYRDTEIFTNTYLEITYPVFILIYFSLMNTVLQTGGIQKKHNLVSFLLVHFKHF